MLDTRPVIKAPEELKEKVIRAYTEKKMTLNVIGKFICARKTAENILKEAGIELKKGGQSLRSKEFNSGHLSYSTRWEDLTKNGESDNN